MIRIRPIQKQDFEQLSQVEFDSFTDPYPKELFRYLASIHPDQFLVAIEKKEESEILLGYAVADIDEYMHQQVGHILSIAIRKKDRRRGIGYRLLSELINVLKAKECSEVLLEVRVSNAVAQALYQKLGFQEVRRSRKFYDNGEDALIMVLDLVEET
jgi:ribosomal-protein-alanine N-acetyltransferase